MSEASVVLKVDSRQAEANLQKFIQNTERAAAAVKPLEYDRVVKIDTNYAVGGLKNLSKEAQGTLDVLTQLTKAGAALFAGSGFARGMIGLTKLASDARETKAQFDHLYAGINEQANAVANTLDKMYGRGKTGAREMLTSTGDLFVGMGMSARKP